MKALSDKKEEILFRRARITELRSKGLRTDSAVAKELGCSRQTVNSDIRVLRRQYDTQIKTWAETKLAYEYETIEAGVWSLLRWAWDRLNDESSSERMKVSASVIILRCYGEMREQMVDKFNIQNGKAEQELFKSPAPLPSSLVEEQAIRDAFERIRLEKGRVF
jgi:DNA-binding CsgD family transcriptional regulator